MYARQCTLCVEVAEVIWMFKEWSEVWEVEIERKNKLVSMSCTGDDAPRAVNRWRVTGTRYRPESKELKVSEKEIQFQEKQTKKKFTKTPSSIPCGGLYYTVDPLNISLFSIFFCFHQHQWLCSIVQQSWGWVRFVRIFPNISATLTIPLQMPRVSGPGHPPPTHPPWADHLGF